MNIIIVGGGKTGAYLASLLGSRGDTVKVIESRKAVAERLEQKLPAGTVLRGVGSSPDVLEQAGVLRADIVIAVTGNDLVVDTLDVLVSEHDSPRFARELRRFYSMRAGPCCIESRSDNGKAIGVVMGWFKFPFVRFFGDCWMSVCA